MSDLGMRWRMSTPSTEGTEERLCNRDAIERALEGRRGGIGHSTALRREGCMSPTEPLGNWEGTQK